MQDFLQFLRRGGIFPLLAVLLLLIVVAALVPVMLYQSSVAAPAVAAPPAPGVSHCAVAETPHYYRYDDGRERENSFGPPVVAATADEAVAELRLTVCRDPRIFAAITARQQGDENRLMPRETWQAELDAFLADPGWETRRLVRQGDPGFESLLGNRTMYMVPGPQGEGSDPIVKIGDLLQHDITTLLVVDLKGWGQRVYRLQCRFQPVGPSVELMEAK